MKIKLPPKPAFKLHSPSKRAAETVINKLEAKSGRLKPQVLALIRKACGDAESEAMNGGRGGWIEAESGFWLVRAKMATIDEWEVRVYCRQYC